LLNNFGSSLAVFHSSEPGHELKEARQTMSALKRINPMVRSIVATIIGLAVVGGIIAATGFGPILVGCPIKGNISKNTGARIYHTPGQEHYAQTRIDWLSGERWFCSEADARAAGWRKSRS
jgi:hypothetical protein